MQRQRTRHVFQAFSTLVAAVMLLALVATGTVLAAGDDTDKVAYHEGQEEKPAHRAWRDKKPGSDNSLYRIGEEFGLTPEEVDKFLYLAQQMARQKHADMWDDNGRDVAAGHPGRGRYGAAVRGPKDPYEALPAGPGYGHRYPGKPVMIEVVTIKRIYMDDTRDGQDFPSSYMDRDPESTLRDGNHPAMMRRMQIREKGPEHATYGKNADSGAHLGEHAVMARGRGHLEGGERQERRPAMAYRRQALEHLEGREAVRPERRAFAARNLPPAIMLQRLDMMDRDSAVAMDLEQGELMAKLAYVLQDPEMVQSLMPAVELFWPGVPDMVENMTGMPLEDLVQDEEMLADLMMVAGPMIADAVEQGLITEEMILQFLTILE